MDRILTLPVDLVLRRTRVESRWQSQVWGLAEILPAGTANGWRPMRETDQDASFLAGPYSLELHPKETIGYKANLETGAPMVYVVLRGDLDAGGHEPIEVHLVTASPYDAEAYGHSGGEVVAQAPLPPDFCELLAAYVAEHHVDETFRKRRRAQHHEPDEHKFGQEPIHELRARQAAARKTSDDQ